MQQQGSKNTATRQLLGCSAEHCIWIKSHTLESYLFFFLLSCLANWPMILHFKSCLLMRGLLFVYFFPSILLQANSGGWLGLQVAIFIYRSVRKLASQYIAQCISVAINRTIEFYAISTAAIYLDYRSLRVPWVVICLSRIFTKILYECEYNCSGYVEWLAWSLLSALSFYFLDSWSLTDVINNSARFFLATGCSILLQIAAVI